MKKGKLIAVICIYLALTLIFALSGILGWKDYKLTMALPVLFLSVTAFIVGKGRDIWLPVALLFSAAGDVMGSQSMLVPQIGCFAAAHVAYTIYFLRKAWLRPGSLLLCLLVAAIGVGLGYVIVSGITDSVVKYSVIGYIFIICLMCMSAILWSRERKGWYVTAAILFMFSDAVIGFTRFGVLEIPYSSVIIMVTYYAAQLIFAVAYLAGFLRTRRFNPAIRA